MDNDDNANKAPVQNRPLIEYTQRWSNAGRRIITTQTNTGELTKPLQRDIQEILDCARLTLEATSAAQSFSGEFADVTIRLHPANNRRLQLEPLKELAIHRTLRSAFRDVMESIHLFLDDVRDVLAVWSMSGEVKAEQFLERIEGERAKFHRLGLSHKIDHLAKTYKFHLVPDITEILLSLNRARNCVVHRRGVVDSQDLHPGTDSLRAIWRETTTLAGPDPSKPETWRKVGPGDSISHPDYLIVAPVPKVVHYPVGVRIAITAQDLSEICNTVLEIAKRIRSQLNKHAKAIGVTIGDRSRSSA